MEYLLTSCCYAEIKGNENDGIYCANCENDDPGLELVDMCDYCNRPGKYCCCP